MPRRLTDLAAGLKRWPDRAGWRRTALELAWAIPLLLLVAYAGGLARIEPVQDMTAVARLAGLLLFAPALGEELLFRGLLIPRRGDKTRWMALSVLLFVLWHPLQAVTFGPPWSAAFLDPWFLGAVALLGTALARIYVATGSLWPCVVAHWLVVLGWKALFAGPF